jgi:hypothetical protein
LWEEFFLWAQVLVTSSSSSSMPLAQHDPLTHKHIICNLILGCAREYFQATCVLAPFFSTPTSSEMISTFTTLYFKSNNFFPLFLEDYESNQDLELSFDSFKLTFQQMPNFFTSGPFGMVFKHL